MKLQDCSQFWRCLRSDCWRCCKRDWRGHPIEKPYPSNWPPAKREPDDPSLN